MRLFDRPQRGIWDGSLVVEGIAFPGGQFCRLGLRGRHRFAVGIDNARRYLASLFLVALIFDFGADGECRRLAAYFRAYVVPPLPHVHWIGFGEPHVAVNTRTLVEPAFGHGRIHPDGQDVLVAEIYEIRYVE